MDFEKWVNKLWKDIELVQVHASEMEAMYKHAMDFEQLTIVEIGSAHGASSVVFAEVAKDKNGQLICIDSYPEYYYDQEKFGEYARKAFMKNVMKKYPKTRFLNMNSNQAAGELRGTEIDILFIDGDHSEEGVNHDCYHYLPMLKSGGYVGFHDYNNPAFSGVKVSADKYCSSWGYKESVWDLAIFKKP